jgi:hypothetical protein
MGIEAIVEIDVHVTDLKTDDCSMVHYRLESVRNVCAHNHSKRE